MKDWWYKNNKSPKSSSTKNYKFRLITKMNCELNNPKYSSLNKKTKCVANKTKPMIRGLIPNYNTKKDFFKTK